ncbi:hypothetical protein DL767_005056 [Monosporascus sp. MG133]|nr:hypothetical protein DL767_005056 [Monosporascus sp. MG133]
MQEPRRQSRAPLETFLHMRFQEREEFLKSLEPRYLQEIESHLRRIQRDRVNFERDPSKKVLMYGLQVARSRWKAELGQGVSSQSEVQDDKGEWSPEPLYGMRARVMYFRSSDNGWVPFTMRHPKYSGCFPNQRVSAFALLEEKEGNPLSEPCPHGTIRYFHFPANHMGWVEKAICRYYGEDPNELNATNPYNFTYRNSDRLLSREFWHGQMYGRKNSARIIQPKASRTTQYDRRLLVLSGRRISQDFLDPRLWLWILDDNTIITFFPRKGGKDTRDPSGVHKALRQRLESGVQDVKSVHHLALLIIDQCSRVFFDRAAPLDARPEVTEIFGAALGNVQHITSIALESFWRRAAIEARNADDNIDYGFLNFINPEATLLREVRSILNELIIMQRVFNEQWNVVSDFRRYLVGVGRDPQRDLEQLAALDKVLEVSMENTRKDLGYLTTVYEADVVLAQIRYRQSELRNLEESGLRIYEEIEDVLSRKEQQAGIISPRATLRRADEAARQSRAIIVFTIVTICFLPLGFFAAFFGMNNQEITGSDWMSLNDQIRYMFGLSAAVIVVSLTAAFVPWMHALVQSLVYVPIVILAKKTGLDRIWNVDAISRKRLELRNKLLLERADMERQQRVKVNVKQREGRAGRRLRDFLERKLESSMSV